MMANTRVWGWLLLLVVLTMTSSTALAVGFQVRSAQAKYTDDILMLDADADFDLSIAAQDALRNSVPLTLVLRIQIVVRGGWFWKNTLTDIERRYQLRYHPLARQFVATNLQTGKLQSFPSQRAALRHIGTLRDFPIIDRKQLPSADAGRSVGRLRAELDVESLPAPLRPLAYLSPNWRLDSEWYQWSL